MFAITLFWLFMAICVSVLIGLVRMILKLSGQISVPSHKNYELPEQGYLRYF